MEALPSPREVWEFFRWIADYLDRRRWMLKREKRRRSRRDPLLYEVLREAYSQLGVEVLTEGGRPWPLAVFPAPESQVKSQLRGQEEGKIQEPLLISLIRDQSPQIPDEMREEGQRFREMRERLFPTILPLTEEDYVTYRMVRMEEREEGPGVVAGIGSFLGMMDSCDLLEREILEEFSDRRPPAGDRSDLLQFFLSLRFRSLIHGRVGNPVVDGSLRDAAIGMSVVLAFYDGRAGGYRLLVRMRSEKVAVHPEMLHVVPSSMFQPSTGYYCSEYSLAHNFLREYLEEVFDYREMARPFGGYPTWFYDRPEVRYLAHLLDSGGAKFIPTGICVNLLNLRPELCALLLIEDPEWFSVHASGGTVRVGSVRLDLESPPRTGREVGPSRVVWEAEQREETLRLRPISPNEEYKSVPIESDLLESPSFSDLVEKLVSSFGLPEALRRVPQAAFVPPAAGALSLALRVIPDVAEKI